MTIQSNEDNGLPPPYADTSASPQHNSTPSVFEIRHIPSRAPASIEISQHGNVLYHIRSRIQQDTPDLVLHAGWDSHGPRLALVQFTPPSKDFQFYIGGLRTPTGEDWATVRCADDGEGGLMGANLGSRHRFYRFESPSENKQKLYWQRTSDAELGASRFSRFDYKLVEEESEDVVAVHIEHGVAKLLGPEKGELTFRRKLDDMGEMAALMVLMGVLEAARRRNHNSNSGSPAANLAF